MDTSSANSAIGVDVMQIDQSAESMLDWAGVARDYLGPTVTNALQHTCPTQRPAEFTFSRHVEHKMSQIRAGNSNTTEIEAAE